MKNLLIIPLLFFTVDGTLKEIPAHQIEALTNKSGYVEVWVSEHKKIPVQGEYRDIVIDLLIAWRD